jgi:trans-aconitate methyltransferase
LVLASPTPSILDAAPDMVEISKRHCGNASWDSTNLANWGAANTDQ